MEHILFLKLAFRGAMSALIAAMVLASIAAECLATWKRVSAKREKACGIFVFSFQAITRLDGASGFLKRADKL